MSYRLDEFLKDMDRHSERVPLDELREKLEDLDLDIEEIKDHVKFGEEHYQRNLIYSGTGFHALALCWSSGQRSPIHDHKGSSCGVKVLKGTATETIFERNAEGMIFPTHTRELFEGGVCGSQDADIHQVSNLMPEGQDLVTLHIYSPPLMVMNIYSLTDTKVGTFHDPVVEFCYGGGI